MRWIFYAYFVSYDIRAQCYAQYISYSPSTVRRKSPDMLLPTWGSSLAVLLLTLEALCDQVTDAIASTVANAIDHVRASEQAWSEGNFSAATILATQVSPLFESVVACDVPVYCTVA
eukprot:3224491-Rhodomonas_salina.3